MTDENNTPWFVGKDVAEVLGYSNASKAVIMHVDKEDTTCRVMERRSRNGNLVKTKTTFINESGVYALILTSKLPQAKEFRKWITGTVLPQIRKTGGYIPISEEDDASTLLYKAEMMLKETLERKRKFELKYGINV